MSDTDAEAASVVTERRLHPAPVTEATDDGDHNDMFTNADDDDDDDVAVTIPGINEPPSLRALVAAAASEPAQGCDWWLPILGFESEVVQDCYDASQGDTRVRGCWVAWALTALAFIQRVSWPNEHLQGWVTLWFLCMAGLMTATLPIALCIISDDFNKRHTLRKIAQGTAFMAVVTLAASYLIRLEGIVHASSASSWEETIFLGCPPAVLPLYISLLLRVSFPWAAMVCICLYVGFLVIIFSVATEPLHLMFLVLFYASAIISMLYGTEALEQQRFMEQLHSTKVERDLHLSEARVAQMESAAILHHTQADLASAQIAQVITKKELTRTQMERAKAEVGGCSTDGQFNILEGITRVKRTPKLAQVCTAPYFRK
jgi:hypothetical protein